jgi:DNA repair exonuclease SbcCD ATPase subunit
MLAMARSELESNCEKAMQQQRVVDELEAKRVVAQADLDSLGGEPADTFYDDLDEAYAHKSNLDRYIQQMEKEMKSENPFVEQIQMMETDNLQEVDYETINYLTKIKEHQEFILKILTDKKSWVRMQIIDQNLGYLNHRLAIYLNKLGLPHNVKFQSDLSVQIEKLGQEFDFDNLSNGESIRLILSLSWAFRDVFETLNQAMNLMFIDELIDSGVDSTGVENTLGVLKTMTREQNKNIFLVSHRDELIARVSNVLMATKENNFTNYAYESDVVS